MTSRERGLAAGRAAGSNATAAQSAAAIKALFAEWRILYPTFQEDLAQALIKYDADRLACTPDYTLFPELRGHADLLAAEREGFKEASGLGALETAHHYSAFFFQTRFLETNHLGRWDHLTATGCTNVFIPGGSEGITISDNRDIALLDDMTPLATLVPDFLFKVDANVHPLNWVQGGVSSAVVLDDAPKCIFPADPFTYQYFLPKEFFDDIDVMIPFLERFNEFWGPGNKILVDTKQRAVISEKTNTRHAYRKAGPNGEAAITACAYLDDNLHAFQLERCKRAAAIKGESEADSLEINYHGGSRLRYRRLTELTRQAAQGKPTIWDALDIASDHAVPYPDRVCLAGESRGSHARNPKENWSVTQHAAVITGPHRRALYRSVQSRQNPKPVYEYTPKLLLAPGVKMQPAWQAEIDSGKCEFPEPALQK
jgi:hypothetical protein